MSEKITVVLSDAPVATTELLDLGVMVDWSAEDSVVAVHFLRGQVVRSRETS